MPLPSFCPLFFCPPTAPSIISPACSQSELVFVIPMKWLLLLAAGEGKRALFTIWQSVRPPASRLHDAQNCPACYRTVILPSMTHHPTHRASSCFLWAWLHSSGPGWHAWPVLLSSSLSGAPRLLCAPLAGLPVIRNNSPSPPPSSPGILVRRTVRWSPFHD